MTCLFSLHQFLHTVSQAYREKRAVRPQYTSTLQVSAVTFVIVLSANVSHMVKPRVREGTLFKGVDTGGLKSLKAITVTFLHNEVDF